MTLSLLELLVAAKNRWPKAWRRSQRMKTIPRNEEDHRHEDCPENKDNHKSKVDTRNKVTLHKGIYRLTLISKDAVNHTHCIPHPLYTTPTECLHPYWAIFHLWQLALILSSVSTVSTLRSHPWMPRYAALHILPFTDLPDPSCGSGGGGGGTKTFPTTSELSTQSGIFH